MSFPYKGYITTISNLDPKLLVLVVEWKKSHNLHLESLGNCPHHSIDFVNSILLPGTRGCRWVIGRTGVIKCMLLHTFYDPCPSDHPPTPEYSCLRAKNRHLFWNSGHQPIKSIVFELFERVRKSASSRWGPHIKITS